MIAGPETFVLFTIVLQMLRTVFDVQNERNDVVTGCCVWAYVYVSL